MRARLLGAAASALIAGGAACGGNGEEPDRTPPVLSEPMIDLAHVVEFLPFGVPLPGSAVLNPTYELRTDVTGLDVRAVAPGVVVAIRGNGPGDDELEIRPSARSVYAIIYDHVVQRTVSIGATVQAGTVLGGIGPWSGSQGRTELQINEDGNPTLAICPERFGTPAFNAAHAAALAATGSDSSVCLIGTVVP